MEKKKERRNRYWQLFTPTFKDVVETATNTVWTLMHWVLGGQCIFSLLIDFFVSTAVLENKWEFSLRLAVQAAGV